MKNTFLLLIIAFSIVTLPSCNKEAGGKFTERFVGTWKSDDFGGSPYEFVITGYKKESIKLNGTIVADVLSNTFSSEPVAGGTYEGDLSESGILYICLEDGVSPICGNFTK